MEDHSRITELLRAWQDGDQASFSAVSRHVYHELKVLAQAHMRRERSTHTLQPTALVHEALLNLQNQKIDIKNRAHFYGIASRTMRRVLVDHARHANRIKRGGNAERVTLPGEVAAAEELSLDILDLDRAMAKLAAKDARKSDILELQFFAGLNVDEVAECLQLSVRTVHRDMRLAKAWLRRELTASPAP